jgi:hypothetical protein
MDTNKIKQGIYYNIYDALLDDLPPLVDVNLFAGGD